MAREHYLRMLKQAEDEAVALMERYEDTDKARDAVYDPYQLGDYAVYRYEADEVLPEAPAAHEAEAYSNVRDLGVTEDLSYLLVQVTNEVYRLAVMDYLNGMEQGNA